MAFVSNPRAMWAPVVAGLFTSFTRLVLQYHRYLWESLPEFFGFWLAHTFAIFLFAALAQAIINAYPKRIFGQHMSSPVLTEDQGMVYICTLIVLADISMLVIHFCFGGGEIDGD